MRNENIPQMRNVAVKCHNMLRLNDIFMQFYKEMDENSLLIDLLFTFQPIFMIFSQLHRKKIFYIFIQKILECIIFVTVLLSDLQHIK